MHSWHRHLAEFLVASAVTAALYWLGTGIANWFLNAFGELAWAGIAGILILFVVAALPIYGGFVLVLRAGLKRKRTAIALAPLAVFAGAYFYEQHRADADAAAVHAKVLELRATELRAFLPLAKPQDVITVPDAYKCDWTCMQALDKSPYGYAVEDNGAWSVNRKQTGAACLTARTLESHIEFMRFGLVETCALVEPWSPAQDHIAIEETKSQPYGKDRLKGMYFDGSTLAAFEQVAGEKRLIGRWLRGTVTMPYRVSAFSWFAETKEDLGADWSNQDFLSALVGQPIAMAIPAEWENADAVMAALVPLFDDDTVRPKAIDAFHLAAQRNPARSDELLVAQALRMMATGRKGQVIAGLSLVGGLSRHKHPDLSFAAAHIIAALRSGDEDLIMAGLYAVWAVPEDQTAQARAAIRELAFSPVLNREKSPLPRTLADRLCEIEEPASAELRRRAGDALRADATDANALPLVMVLAKGDAGSRAAAMTLVLGLDARAFALAVRAISNKGWKCVAGASDDDWSRRELEAVVPRFRHVPADQLVPLYHSFARSAQFKEMKPLVRDVLAARLKHAEAQPNPDTNEIDRLHELLRFLR